MLLPVKYKPARPIEASKLKDIEELIKYIPPVHQVSFNDLTSDADKGMNKDDDGFDIPDYV